MGIISVCLPLFVCLSVCLSVYSLACLPACLRLRQSVPIFHIQSSYAIDFYQLNVVVQRIFHSAVVFIQWSSDIDLETAVSTRKQ
jgi:hypothetical protein